MYYASFGMLSIVIHIIINFMAMKKDKDGDNDIIWNRYRMFLFGVMIYYVSDILWGFLYDLKNVLLVYSDTVLYFLSMGLTVFLWMRFTVAFLNQKTVFDKILLYFGWSIFTFGIITIMVNFFFPIMFSFDSDGVYYPGRARYTSLGLQFILFLVMVFYTLMRSTKVGGRDKLHHLAIGISGLVMSVFIVLQTLYPFLPFYAIGCLVATCIIHSFVVVDEKVNHNIELGSVKQIAYRDPLTNVKNINAYMVAKDFYDERIKEHTIDEFGLVVFDLNDLKKVNDSMGHEAGDEYLKAASKLICTVLKHSPVFRIGGDEFVSILEGEDYYNREELFAAFNERVEANIKRGDAVISAGMDIYHQGSDGSFDDIFNRADNKMYERKKELKHIG